MQEFMNKNHELRNIPSITSTTHIPPVHGFWQQESHKSLINEQKPGTHFPCVIYTSNGRDPTQYLTLIPAPSSALPGSVAGHQLKDQDAQGPPVHRLRPRSGRCGAVFIDSARESDGKGWEVTGFFYGKGVI